MAQCTNNRRYGGNSIVQRFIQRLMKNAQYSNNGNNGGGNQRGHVFGGARRGV
jgi:hypothetical protein